MSNFAPLGSNIAHYSRYHIVHSTLVKAVRMPGGEVSAQFSDSVASQLKPLLEENAEHTCYELNAADMRARFLQLGLLVRQVLTEAKAAGLAGFELLERVFGEQYRINAETGGLEAIPSKEISARSVQNPNDPEATYRNKNGEDVRGYTYNATETCDDEDKATTARGKVIQKPKLIVDVAVEPASTPDPQLFEGGVKGSEDVTGQKPESVASDGGYQSAGNQEFADSEGIEAVFTGFQGRKGAYDLELSPDGKSLEATKTATGEKLPTSMTKGGSWHTRGHEGRQKTRALRQARKRGCGSEAKGAGGHPQGEAVAEEQCRGRHVPAHLPHPQQQDPLQGADEAENIRPLTLPMGEPCPLGTV